MVIIGVDPHKRTHTASALDPGSQRMLESLEIDATLAGYGHCGMSDPPVVRSGTGMPSATRIVTPRAVPAHGCGAPR